MSTLKSDQVYIYSYIYITTNQKWPNIYLLINIYISLPTQKWPNIYQLKYIPHYQSKVTKYISTHIYLTTNSKVTKYIDTPNTRGFLLQRVVSSQFTIHKRNYHIKPEFLKTRGFPTTKSSFLSNCNQQEKLPHWTRIPQN